MFEDHSEQKQKLVAEREEFVAPKHPLLSYMEQ